MRVKIILVFFISIVFLMSYSIPCLAITLLTEREALRKIFEQVDNIDTEQKIFSSSQIEKIKKELGGQFVHYGQDSEVKDIANQKEFIFYFGIKDGKRIGAAVILDEPGKWGPITFMIGLNLDATVKEVCIMKYTESRGRSIARKSFLQQFQGKTAKDSLIIDKDIVGISGATISASATAFTVKKALLLYKEFLVK